MKRMTFFHRNDYSFYTLKVTKDSDKMGIKIRIDFWIRLKL